MNGHLRERSPTHWALCYPVPRVMGTAVQPRHGKASGHHHYLYWRPEGRGTGAAPTSARFGTRPKGILARDPISFCTPSGTIDATYFARPQVQSMPPEPDPCPRHPGLLRPQRRTPQRRTPQRHRLPQAERPDVLRAVPSIRRRRSIASAMTSSPHHTKPPAHGSLPSEVKSRASRKDVMKGPQE
jgi:hypothetical protein